MKNIKVLKFNEFLQTESRRTKPRPQMARVDGTADKSITLNNIQCIPVEYTVLGPKWKCTTTSDHKVKLSNFIVSCEGWANAEDEYILEGSCGIKYHLDNMEVDKNGNVIEEKKDTTAFDILMGTCMTAFPAYIIYQIWKNRHNDDQTNNDMLDSMNDPTGNVDVTRWNRNRSREYLRNCQRTSPSRSSPSPSYTSSFTGDTSNF
uniref:Store-operated calcium entry-associated regulatory factor n=1 Tax=Rhabditophanes sp. KR3021 TaxID=114890 RepID=A0AC35U644_9BILA